MLFKSSKHSFSFLLFISPMFMTTSISSAPSSAAVIDSAVFAAAVDAPSGKSMTVAMRNFALFSLLKAAAVLTQTGFMQTALKPNSVASRHILITSSSAALNERIVWSIELAAVFLEILGAEYEKARFSSIFFTSSGETPRISASFFALFAFFSFSFFIFISQFG